MIKIRLLWALAIAAFTGYYRYLRGVVRGIRELPARQSVTLLWRPSLAQFMAGRLAGADGITGLGTTYNLPNYHGMLIGITPADTPFLSAIGGLTPGPDQIVQDTEFGWGFYDLRDPSVRARLEGADAPTSEERVRYQIKNVAQVTHESVAVSYTKLAAAQRLSGLNTGNQANQVLNEMLWQVTQQIKQAARDVNYSFLNGKYNLPGDNSTARKTRGIIEAASTDLPSGLVADPNVLNVAAAGKAFTVADTGDLFTATAHGYSNGDQVILSGLTGGAGLAEDTVYYVIGVTANTFQVSLTYGGSAVVVTSDGSGTVRKSEDYTSDDVIDLLQQVWDQGGIRESEAATLIANSYGKRLLTKAFITDKSYREVTRNVGGVNLQTIETDFGRLNIMLDRAMPKHKLLVASLEQVHPKFLEVPEGDGSGVKGTFFIEPLAKTGAQEKSQLYGEIGLAYGNPLAHGVLTGGKVRA